MSADLIIVPAMPARQPRPRPLRPVASNDIDGQWCRHQWEPFRTFDICVRCGELSHQDGTVLSWREVHALLDTLRREQRVLDQQEAGS